MTSPGSIAKKVAAGILKGSMALGMLIGLIAIPYLIGTETWDFLVGLYRQHPIWFALLVLPIIYVAVKLWKWLYELLGAAMANVGGIVDRLERDQK